MAMILLTFDAQHLAVSPGALLVIRVENYKQQCLFVDYLKVVSCFLFQISYRERERKETATEIIVNDKYVCICIGMNPVRNETSIKKKKEEKNRNKYGRWNKSSQSTSVIFYKENVCWLLLLLNSNTWAWD